MDWMETRGERAAHSKPLLLVSATQLLDGDAQLSSPGQSLRLETDPWDLLERHLIHRERRAVSVRDRMI